MWAHALNAAPMLNYAQIPAQQAYTKEKIEPSAFSSGATVDSLIRDMEALFAARFGRWYALSDVLAHSFGVYSAG